MKKHLILLTVILLVTQGSNGNTLPRFKKVTLSDKFYAEGAYYGDFNRDGKLDIVAGPFWYEGPKFKKKHEIYPPKAFDPHDHADNFLTFAVDLNGDGWDDVLVCPHPGLQGRWYENPKAKNKAWICHEGPVQLGNESPQWTEIVKGMGQGLIYNINGHLGFGTCDLKDGLPKWNFHPISTQSEHYERYTHGIGYGDINGDGRTDLVERIGWWEQPADPENTPWPFHPYIFAEAGAQMLVFDIDGDGRNDIVTSWDCHNYGLLWYKQISGAQGEIQWQRNEILPIVPDLQSDELRISQMHALDWADFNNDGLPDLVTGKRFWAHGPDRDMEPNAPAVLYWFELRRDGQGNARFIPHQIDNDSGIGMQVTPIDLNGDKTPDVIVSNKKGTFVFLSY